jgi:hypothetical protein
MRANELTTFMMPRNVTNWLRAKRERQKDTNINLQRAKEEAGKDWSRANETERGSVLKTSFAFA